MAGKHWSALSFKEYECFMMFSTCLRCFDTHLAQVLPHHLNEVRHGEVHQAVSPGQLQNHVRSQKIIRAEETRGETLALPLLNKPAQEVLSPSAVLRLGRELHRVLTTDREPLAWFCSACLFTKQRNYPSLKLHEERKWLNQKVWKIVTKLL